MLEKQATTGYRVAASRNGTVFRAGPATSTAAASSELNVNVSADIAFTRMGSVQEITAGCRSRTGVKAENKSLTDLPETEVPGFLAQHEGKILDWLGKSAQNQKAFLADPVGALASAGVELSRSEIHTLQNQRALIEKSELAQRTTLARASLSAVPLTRPNGDAADHATISAIPRRSGPAPRTPRGRR